MNALPYIGCALTIIDPGPMRPRSKYSGYNSGPRRNRNGSLRLMKVVVEAVRGLASYDIEKMIGVKYVGAADTAISWRAGCRQGQVLLSREGTEWVRGHGPAARDSLLAMRMLVGSL